MQYWYEVYAQGLIQYALAYAINTIFKKFDLSHKLGLSR